MSFKFEATNLIKIPQSRKARQSLESEITALAPGRWVYRPWTADDSHKARSLRAARIPKKLFFPKNCFICRNKSYLCKKIPYI